MNFERVRSALDTSCGSTGPWLTLPRCRTRRRDPPLLPHVPASATHRPRLLRRPHRLLRPEREPFEFLSNISPSPPRGDMGEICRKLSFCSSVLPNAPKCNHQLISNTMTRDTAWRMRVPAEWHSLQYPPVQVIGGHLPKDRWAFDLRVSW